MDIFKSLQIILLMAAMSYGQIDTEIIPAHPVLGYSVLNDSISYFPIARNAAVQSEFETVMSIDSLGNIKNLKLKPIFRDSLPGNESFITVRVKKILMNFKWNPAILNGKPINSNLSIPFIFLLKSNNHSYESDRAYVVELISGGLRQEPIIKTSFGPIIWRYKAGR